MNVSVVGGKMHLIVDIPDSCEQCIFLRADDHLACNLDTSINCNVEELPEECPITVMISQTRG